MQQPQEADFRPGAVFYLTNAAGAPISWVVYQGPVFGAFGEPEARVFIQNQPPVRNVIRARLRLVPGYEQINPENYLLQQEEPQAPPAPQDGYAAAGGRRRRTVRRRKNYRRRTVRRR